MTHKPTRAGAACRAVRASLASLLLFSAGCGSRPQTSAPPIPIEEQPVRSRASLDEAIADGTRWLVANQRPGGYWGTGCKTWGFYLYSRVPGSHQAFKGGTAGLCAMALREVGTPEALEAARRGELWLATEGAKVRRADQDEIYNVWTHIYALQALAAAIRAEGDPERLAILKRGAAEHVDLLRRYESVYGGWMYYDFFAHTQRPSYPPTSFTTAAGLIAFREAIDAGIEVPEAMVKRCLRLVEKCRLPNGAYLYAYGHRYRPMHPVNQVKGSLGRTQCCNDALEIWGSKVVKPVHVRQGLDDLFRLQAFLEIGRKKPIPHEAYYAVSGYFYYYGHYYAARLIERMPKDEARPWAEKMSALIRSHQEEDGTWWDYNAVWDFDKPYGTAYALLILLRCREVLQDKPTR